MAIGLGGATFDSDGSAGIRQAASQVASFEQQRQHNQLAERRFEQQMRQQELREQRQEQAQRNASQSMISTSLNGKNYSVGALYQPYVNEQLQDMMVRYSDMNRSGVDQATLRAMLEAETTDLRSRAQGFKEFNAAVSELSKNAKNYGLSRTDIENVIKDKMLYQTDEKGNKKLKPFSELNFEEMIPELETVLTDNAGELSPKLGSQITKSIQSRQLSTDAGNYSVTTKDSSGRTSSTTRNSTVSYDPLIDEIVEDGKIKHLKRRESQFIDHDGKPYVEPGGTTPAAPVLPDDAFTQFYEYSPSVQFAYDARAQQMAKEYQAKGYSVGVADMEYFKRKAVTEAVNQNYHYKHSQAQADKSMEITVRTTGGGGGGNNSKSESTPKPEKEPTYVQKLSEAKAKREYEKYYAKDEVAAKTQSGSVAAKPTPKAPPKPAAKTGQVINSRTGKQITEGKIWQRKTQ